GQGVARAPAAACDGDRIAGGNAGETVVDQVAELVLPGDHGRRQVEDPGASTVGVAPPAVEAIRVPHPVEGNPVRGRAAGGCCPGDAEGAASSDGGRAGG